MIGVLTPKFLIPSFIIDQLQNQNDQSPLNFLMRSRFDHDQNPGIKFFDATEIFFSANQRCHPELVNMITTMLKFLLHKKNHDVD
jgi:hypothetical protein